MYNFTFHRPTTVRQAAGLLARNPDGKLLAGGHSLLPVMKQRLASPSALIDLSLVEGITGVELKGRSVVIGAMTRHADVIFVVLAWIFVLSRLAHAYVHTTSNIIMQRGPLFCIGLLVLLIMWLIFIVRILIGLP